MCRKQATGSIFWLILTVFFFATGSARGDRGEGFVEVDARGGLSILRNPELVYGRRGWQPDAATVAFGGRIGLGLTDWLDMGLGARWYLPRSSVAEDVSLQGFVGGDVAFRHAALQVPVSVSLRRSRGGPMSVVVTAEAGVELSRWEVTSMARHGEARSFYAIAPLSTWKRACFTGLHVGVEWRSFDHVSIRVGPSLSIDTAGTTHLGLVLAGDFLWGVGLAP